MERRRRFSLAHWLGPIAAVIIAALVKEALLKDVG